MNTNQCGFCGGKLKPILSLGDMPIVNYFPRKEELRKEKTYPLDFCVCTECGLAQVGKKLDPKQFFTTYHYVSGASEPLVAHLHDLAHACLSDFRLSDTAKVLDIGCNDGSFLEAFLGRQMRVLGIDPAKNVIEAARKKGIDVIPAFFSSALAKKVRKTHGQFDLIVTTHTLANVFDLQDFLSGVVSLLADEGAFVLEVGSLSAMLKKGQFDAIYHEHYYYFSIQTLQHILESVGLKIIKVEENMFHGGSLHVYAQVQSSKFKVQSSKDEITDVDYEEFVEKTRIYKKKMRELFRQLKGKKVVGFGAPAKAVTLLNYCNLGPEQVAFLVDSTVFKQGRYVPGVHIPIFPEDTLAKTQPEYIMVFAWNYLDEIVKKLRTICRKGTKIIVPFPRLLTRELFAYP